MLGSRCCETGPGSKNTNSEQLISCCVPGCVNGGTSRLLLKFRSCTHGLLEELGRQASGGVSQECSKCRPRKESVEHIFKIVHNMIPRDKFVWTI